MDKLTMCSQVLWLDSFIQEKLYFSQVIDQIRLCSEDGFSVSLPVHFLLASSRVFCNTLLPDMAEQYVLLPSVKGATLMVLVELLRTGMTRSLGMMDNTGCMLKEVQEAMELLQIQGCVSLMRVKKSSSKEEATIQENRAQGTRTISASNTTVTKDSSTVKLASQKGEATTSPCSSSVNFTAEGLKNTNLEIIFTKNVVLENKMDCGSDVSRSVALECHVCKKKYPNKKSLATHIGSVHSVDRFPCTYCVKTFMMEANLQKHISSCHEGNRIRCDFCQATFNALKNLRRHMKKNHANKMHSCQACGKMFVHEINMLNHMKSSHEGIVFKCDECPATFRGKVKLLRHIKFVHSGISLCSYCPSTFSYKPSLQRHMKTTHCDKFLVCCEECGKRFQQEDCVKKHVRFCPNRKSQIQ